MVLFIRQSYSYDRKVKRIHIKCSSLLHICWRIQFVQYHYIPNIPLLFCYRISRMRLRRRWNGTTISTGKVWNVAYKAFLKHIVTLRFIFSFFKRYIQLLCLIYSIPLHYLDAVFTKIHVVLLFFVSGNRPRTKVNCCTKKMETILKRTGRKER